MGFPDTEFAIQKTARLDLEGVEAKFRRTAFLLKHFLPLVADAKVCGSLYDFGLYPGLRLNESKPLVVGEVYEVDDETLNKAG